MDTYDLNSWMQEVFEVLEAHGLDYLGDNFYEAKENINNLKQKILSGTITDEEMQLFHLAMQKTRNYLNANVSASQGFKSFANDIQKFDRCYKIYIKHFYKKGLQEPPNNHSACYIATAVYGSYEAPEVLKLRFFRDEILAKSGPGRLFISLYYVISPRIADKLKHRSYVNQFVRGLLDRFIAFLN